ncbi:MAG: TonB-dependent receptor [Candidatus Neomarinimicrobiota bacterium]
MRFSIRRHCKIWLCFLSVLTLIASQTPLFAQGKCVIEGHIRDLKTGEPLIGVNVVVLGTYYGSSTDMNGYYLIQNIKPAEYTLELSYIGYKIIQKTGVRINPNEKLTLDFNMEQTALALGQEVVVIGEKPLLQMKETGTVRSVNRQDIANRPLDNVQDILSEQVGVTKTDNEIHVRGSRTYEVQYLLDNISVQDPLSGTGYGLNISPNAIEEVEVITGGFRAEYGQATSGIVNVKTKTGGDRYEGYLSYKSDNLGLFRDKAWSFNTDIFEMNFSGKEPMTMKLLPAIGLRLPGKFYFFMNLYSLIGDDYTGSTAKQLRSSITPTLSWFGKEILTPTTFTPRENNNWNGLYKLTWKMDDTHKLTFSYNRSLVINQNTQSLQTTLEYVEPGPGFPYAYSQNLENFNTYTHDNEQISLAWSHTLNNKTFYEIRASQYWAHLRSDWNGLPWTEYSMPTDVSRIPVEYFVYYNNTQKIRVIPGDGFYDYGNSDFWHDHYVEWYTIKGDINTIFNKIHSVKAGFESSYKEMQMIDIIDPWTEGGYGSSQDIYRVYPADGAFYCQDDIKFEGFYLNVGLRLDYWFPGKYVDDAIKNPDNLLTDEMRKEYLDETYSLFGNRYKMRLMPRLGVSHPISDNQMLFFNYGHFSKQPRPQFVYAKLGSISSKSSYQKFGNPNLNPETSVIYELGIRHKFSEDDVISVTSYYKDIFDYVQTTTVTGIPRIGSAVFYINLDYARSRGVEVEYKTRLGRNFSGMINGSYSIATTKSSSPDVGMLVAQGSISEQPIKETYAVWDRPWQVSLTANYAVPKGKGPKIFGFRFFGNWNFNLRCFAQAGKRYTPAVFEYYRSNDNRPIYVTVADQSLSYSKIGEMWKWADFSIKKYFNYAGMKYTFSIEIKNLFNNKNVNIINPVTGDAYSYGDPVPSSWNDPLYPDLTYPVSDPYPLNPARYKEPRNIRFGISVEF